jgi:hypothetical protein
MVVLRGLRGGLENMLEAYAANMEDDLDWAADWSQPDDWHSRLDNSWVSETFHEGMVEGIREAFIAFAAGYGIHPLPDPLEGLGQGNIFTTTARVARGAARAASSIRLALQSAKRLRLAAASSAAEIASVFKRLGYRVDPEFVDRLRGVNRRGGLHPADPQRMASLGLRTVDDVLDVLRKGRPRTLKDGKVGIVRGRAMIIMNPESRTLITLIGSDW